MIKQLFSQYKFLLLLLFITALAVFPLLQDGLPPTHDGEYHVIRFYEFYRTLSEGSIYPRWAPDLYYAYGSPLFNYVYPLPNYIAAGFHLLGLSFIDGFKANMVVASFIGALFFFSWSRRHWGVYGAITSSIFYTYAPYHLLDIYVRGSVGEVWALAFFPAFLWALEKTINEENMRFVALSATFFSFIIFSHNILAVMFTIFTLSYVIFLYSKIEGKRSFTTKSVSIFLLALGMAAIFWVPALLEKQYVRGLQIYTIKENFPEVYQLLFPSWGTGFSGEGGQNQMSFQIGVANLFVIFLSFIALLFGKRQKWSIVIFFLLWFFFLCYLMLQNSVILWETIPLLAYFQFPWRLLSLVILVTSFLAGYVVSAFYSKISTVLLSVICILLSITYTHPAYYHLRDDSYYINRSNFIDGTNSPGNLFNTIWAKGISVRAVTSFYSQVDVMEIQREKKGAVFKEINLEVKKNTKVTLSLLHFPGWVVYVDGIKTNTAISEQGLITFPIQTGRHTVRVTLQSTYIQSVASVISLVSFFVVFLLFVRNSYVTMRK